MAGKRVPHRRLLPDGQGRQDRATVNLVVPLAHEATAMRITDTDGTSPSRSGAVSRLSDRPGDDGGGIGIWKEGDDFCARISLDALAEFNRVAKLEHSGNPA